LSAGVSVYVPAETVCIVPIPSRTLKSAVDPMLSVFAPLVSSTRTRDTGAWPISVPGK
jgi:hypothetical protein